MYRNTTSMVWSWFDWIGWDCVGGVGVAIVVVVVLEATVVVVVVIASIAAGGGLWDGVSIIMSTAVAGSGVSSDSECGDEDDCGAIDTVDVLNV